MWLFQQLIFKLPSLNISVSSAVFPAALHGDSPKPHCTASQLAGSSFPLVSDGKNTCWKDVLQVVGGCSYPWMQLYLWRKKSWTLSPEHPQSLSKIWSLSRNLNSFNSKEKAGSLSSAAVSALATGFPPTPQVHCDRHLHSVCSRLWALAQESYTSYSVVSYCTGCFGEEQDCWTHFASDLSR